VPLPSLLWTTPDDVHERWLGDATLSASDATLTTLLADVEDTVVSEFPDLLDRVAAGFPVLRVRKVIARVVIRHLQNPEGVRSTQDGAGPFQHATTYGGNEPGSLSLTDADRAELSDGVRGGAFTIDMTPTCAPSASLPPSIDPVLWNDEPDA
jgi:hypothetical protein